MGSIETLNFNPEQVIEPEETTHVEGKNLVDETSDLVSEKNREQQERVLPEEGPEQWAKELPPKTFGTEKERRNNFEELFTELSKEKDKCGISEEEFEKRLKEAKEYTESMPLFHGTSLKRTVGIFNLGKIASKRTLKKEKGLLRTLFQSNTLAVDKRAGLDKMVFTSLYPNDYGDVTLEVDGKILDRPDCVTTREDIINTLGRVCPAPPGKLSGLFLEYAKEYLAMSKVLGEYKSQVISGKSFKEFISHYFAIYGIPEYYQELQDEGLHSETINSPSTEAHNAPSSDIKKWITPEVKVRNEISTGNIKKVVVKNKEHADLLISNGVPEDLIEIVNSREQ